jgi:tetratricopeptide (TPR) repeat protein
MASSSCGAAGKLQPLLSVPRLDIIRYLYEREYYELARSFANTSLKTFPDKASLAFASATDLVGLIDLDMAQPEKALENFEVALRIRKIQLGDEDSFIAYSLNNLALAYTEIPKLDEAYKIHNQAIDMRLRMNSDRVGNSYSNMCSLLLRMGKPDEAEEMLTRCPELKDLTDETFLHTGNPRWVGDMVVLSRIRMAQGRPEDALRLASKALDFRQRANGGRLKTCDSLYDVACLLHHQGKSATAT